MDQNFIEIRTAYQVDRHSPEHALKVYGPIIVVVVSLSSRT